MELGLFSISYAGLWGQAKLPLPEFIRHASQLGFGSVMLAGKRPHLSPLDWSEHTIQKLNGELAQARLRCDVVAGYVDLSAVVSSEVPMLEMQISYVVALAHMAKQLGATIVRVFTSYEDERVGFTANWQRCVTALQEICDRIAPFGVQLAVQNHHDIAVHTDAMLELLCDVGRTNCKLGFDAWSVALRGEDLYEAARKAAPHTVLTTNADYVRLPRYHYRPDFVNYEAIDPDMVRAVPFGSGFIDYAAFFQGLRDGGFDGPAMYEICSPVRGGGQIENLDHCAKTYLHWMRERSFSSAASHAR